MDPQSNPTNQTPQNPLKQPAPILPKSSSWGKMILISLGVLGLGMAIAFGGFYLGQQSEMQKAAPTPTLRVSPTHIASPSTPASPTTTQQSYEENTILAGQKKYISPHLGISFLYLTKQGDETVAVKEVGNRIYLYSTRNPYTQGQYVDVYTKAPTDTLQQAIRKQLLSKYSQNCYVKNPAYRVKASLYPSSYQTASVWYKDANGQDATFTPGEGPNPPEAATDCNTNLMPIGGLVYFLEDTAHPNTFVFFSIGQYPIMADAQHMWQDTIQFLP